MERDMLSELIAWKDTDDRSPLLIRGARQVGKTYLVKSFGEIYFEDTLAINFEKDDKFKAAFATLDPKEIINRLYLQSSKMLVPGKCLLFLDEIQECTRALQALRYFKEDMPELHVIATGSLLEFALSNESIRMPLGRVESLFLRPLSFQEFLTATQSQHLREYLANVDFQKGIDDIVHEKLCESLRNYYFTGGMPAIVNEYITSNNLERVQTKQRSLIQTFKDDFGKYASKANHVYMQKILQEAPSLMSRNFQYSKIDPDMGSREIKKALNFLLEAGLLFKVTHTSAVGLPLGATANDKKFKLLYLDIGMVNSLSNLLPEIFVQKDLMLLNRGIQSEQFVGQELLCYNPPYMSMPLYYWDRSKPSSTAEVDYVINVNDLIIPIEVKSGRTGSLRSLQLFLNEKKCNFGIRLSLKPLSFKNRVLSIPLYMINEIPRIVKQVIHD